MERHASSERAMRGGIQVSTESVIATMTPSQKPPSRDPYEYSPAHLFGTQNGLFERHLLYDNVIERTSADSRDRFEAFARAVRDILSQRWVATESTYDRLNPKRIYYLSMEFLIGRSLANNVTNLLLDPAIRKAVEHNSLDWTALLDEEPDAALGNGGLGRLAACFLDSMATMQLPAMGYGLRYHYGIFRQQLQDGYQVATPDPWLHHPDPWEVAHPADTVAIPMQARACLVNGVE